MNSLASEDALSRRRRPPDALRLRESQFRFDHRSRAFGNTVLELEGLAHSALEAIGPKMRAAAGFDELRGDVQPLLAAAHAAFQDEAHPELPADLTDVDGPALVDERRVACDHLQPRAIGQSSDDLLGHAIGEVVRLGLAAHIGERKNGDRRPVGQRHAVRSGCHRHCRC